jgi:hypothetical protein
MAQLRRKLAGFAAVLQTVAASRQLRIELWNRLCEAIVPIHTLVNFAGLHRTAQKLPPGPGPVGPMTMPRRFAILAPAILAVVVASSGAGAQGMPPPPSGPPVAQPPQQQPMPSANPVCGRLEAQLAALDRGGGDAARGEQIRRYEEAVQGQQTELDRTVAHARRTGCEGSGFFLFGRSQPPQCDELNGRIQRMRSNLDRLNSDLQQLRMSGRSAAEGQRQQVLAALGQNDCGPQYRVAAAPARPRGIFETLFGGGGGGGGITAPFGSGDVSPNDQSSTYRTICVRTCDGFYFPVSYSASPAKFRDDEQACQRMCPASEVMLFTYRNPGEDVAQAVSPSGQPYSSLPNAFRYRQEFNSACSCRRPGESWADALKHLDDVSVERGDIIVTDENAKALSQPKPEPRATKQSARAKAGAEPAGTPAPVTAAPLPAAAEPAPAAPPPPVQAEAGKKSIRSVGPPFIVR